MAEIPVIPYQELGPHTADPLALAKICREQTQAFFDAFNPGAKAPAERVLKNDEQQEKFDSATMLFFTELIVEWIADEVQLHLEAKSDDMHFYETVLAFKLSLHSPSAEFQVNCDSVVKTTYYAGASVTYLLKLSDAKVTAKGLGPEPLEKLAKLLNLPPQLVLAQAV